MHLHHLETATEELRAQPVQSQLIKTTRKCKKPKEEMKFRDKVSLEILSFAQHFSSPARNTPKLNVSLWWVEVKH